MLVLLVDDNQDNRLAVEKQLIFLGCEVHGVESGEEALEAFKQFGDQYGLILMDCQMPGLDGYETTRRIRERETGHGRRVPVIALTASSRGEVYDKAIDAGMDDSLFKPVTLENLHDILERWTKP